MSGEFDLEAELGGLGAGESLDLGDLGNLDGESGVGDDDLAGTLNDAGDFDLDGLDIGDSVGDLGAGDTLDLDGGLEGLGVDLADLDGLDLDDALAGDPANSTSAVEAPPTSSQSNAAPPADDHGGLNVADDLMSGLDLDAELDQELGAGLGHDPAAADELDLGDDMLAGLDEPDTLAGLDEPDTPAASSAEVGSSGGSAGGASSVPAPSSLEQDEFALTPGPNLQLQDSDSLQESGHDVTDGAEDSNGLLEGGGHGSEGAVSGDAVNDTPATTSTTTSSAADADSAGEHGATNTHTVGLDSSPNTHTGGSIDSPSAMAAAVGDGLAATTPPPAHDLYEVLPTGEDAVGFDRSADDLSRDVDVQDESAPSAVHGTDGTGEDSSSAHPTHTEDTAPDAAGEAAEPSIDATQDPTQNTDGAPTHNTDTDGEGPGPSNATDGEAAGADTGGSQRSSSPDSTASLTTPPASSQTTPQQKSRRRLAPWVERLCGNQPLHAVHAAARCKELRKESRKRAARLQRERRKQRRLAEAEMAARDAERRADLEYAAKLAAEERAATQRQRKMEEKARKRRLREARKEREAQRQALETLGRQAQHSYVQSRANVEHRRAERRRADVRASRKMLRAARDYEAKQRRTEDRVRMLRWEASRICGLSALQEEENLRRGRLRVLHEHHQQRFRKNRAKLEAFYRRNGLQWPPPPPKKDAPAAPRPAWNCGPAHQRLAQDGGFSQASAGVGRVPGLLEDADAGGTPQERTHSVFLTQASSSSIGSSNDQAAGSSETKEESAPRRRKHTHPPLRNYFASGPPRVKKPPKNFVAHNMALYGRKPRKIVRKAKPSQRKAAMRVQAHKVHEREQMQSVASAVAAASRVHDPEDKAAFVQLSEEVLDWF